MLVFASISIDPEFELAEKIYAFPYARTAPRRRRLREATAPLHTACEEIVQSADFFGNKSRYGYFIAVMHGAYATLEPLLESGGVTQLLPDWGKRKRLCDLEHDCEALGVETPAHPSTFALPAGAGGLLGALYVTEGSTLGARLLAVQARRIGISERNGAHFLTRQAREMALWPDFLDTLESTPLPGAGEDDMLEAAHATFSLVRDLLTQSPLHRAA